MIGIITATKEEFAALNQALNTNKTGIMNFTRGMLGGKQVAGVQAGIGKVNAALCAQTMIDRFRPEAIVNVGVAGSLSDDLKVGDLVISRDAVQHDFDASFFGQEWWKQFGMETIEFKADEKLVSAADRAADKLGYAHEVGRIVSGDQFICTWEKKKELGDKFQAQCCEMEGAAIAQVSFLNRIPFVVIRAISDGADDEAGQSYMDFGTFAAQRAVKLIQAMLEEM